MSRLRVPDMLTKSQFKRRMDETNNDLEKCWEYLCNIRGMKSPSTLKSSLLDFQPTLANAIAKLTGAYNEIAKAKRGLIARKAQTSRPWFTSQMRRLGKQQNEIDLQISIGRSMGDAFAWFFYQRSRHFLREHLKQPLVKHAPPGLGGQAERDFIRRHPIINQRFVVYHGVTNILRLGDLTFVDLKTFEVVGIGEIKAEAADTRSAKVSMFATTWERNGLPNIPTPNTESVKPEVVDLAGRLPSARDRFRRQLKKIDLAFPKLRKQKSESISVESSFYGKELDSLVRSVRRGQMSYRQAGRGLLLVAYHTNSKAVLRRLKKSDKTASADAPDLLIEQTKKILIPQRSDNSIEIGTLFYDRVGNSPHMPGMTHLFWWPIESKTAHAILFRKVTVMTIFNRSALFEEMERQGLTVEQQADRSVRVTQRIDNKIFEFGEVSYYLRAMQGYLMDECFVVNTLVAARQKALAMNKDFMRIDLELNQHFGVPPTEIT